MRSISRANYEEDDVRYVTGFLDVIAEHKCESRNESNANLSYEPTIQ